MTILNIQLGSTGLAGIVPRMDYIYTNDTQAEVLTAGYLNHSVDAGFSFSQGDLACVTTQASPTARLQSGVYFVDHNGSNWNLVAPTDSANFLSDGNIFVGNVSGVATSVTMSGDATIINTGALTIAADAITTAKILNANVTLAKLAAGITPSHVIKFANQVTTVGGAAAEAFTVTGAAAATDRAFVQVVNDGTGNVTVLQAVVTNNTLTVTFSANPGNDTVINYQIIRVAS